MSKKYTTDYYLKKFKAIPANKWVTRNFESSDGKRKCAFGWCNALENPEGFEPRTLFKLFNKNGLCVEKVNDGKDQHFKQKGPRARIIAALNWIKSQEKGKKK